MKTYNVVTRENRNLEVKSLITRMLDDNYQLSIASPDYCFVVGGDGTFLHAVHQYMDKLDKIIFIGINSGTLGFYSDYDLSEAKYCVNDFLKKDGYLESYCLIKATTDKGKTYHAINEVRIETLLRAQEIDVTINQEFFENFRGSGFLVCSAYGSSAYNRSIKGAIISTEIDCLQLSEISPVVTPKHPTLNSSIVFPKDTKIIFENQYFKNVSLLYDNQEVKLTNEKKIEVSYSDKKVRVLRLRSLSYLDRIKKLF